MIESLQGGYRTQAINTYTTQSARRPDGVRETDSGDSVSISGQGRLMSDFFSGLGVEFTPGKPLTLDDLEAGLDRKQAALEDGIQTLFLQNGIATTPPVELTTDADGDIRVSGDHPRKKDIEALFRDNPELANDFRGVSMLSTLVESGRELASSSGDPHGAVAQYLQQFSGQPGGDYTLTIDGGLSAGTTDAAEDAAAADAAAGTVAPATARPDFSNLTRKGLLDWVNGELTSGRMTFEESSAFLAMTVKISAETGQTVDLADDTERYDFTDIARRGIEGALWRGDQEAADRLRAALEIMEG